MKKIIFISIAFIVAMSAKAQKNANIDHAKELLVLTGSGSLAKQMMTSMAASYKKAMPQVPTEFWDDFIKEVNEDELIELLIPVYTKYYTDEELVQLIAFYKSPLGKKVIEKMPLIMQESYTIGVEWGKKLGEKVVEKLRDKGLIQKD